MSELESQLRSLHEASFQWAMHCTGGRRQDAEDALQSAYEALLNGSARFDGRSTLKTFFFGVIRNKARSGRRKMRWGRLVALDSAEPETVEATGSAGLEKSERDARLRAALGELSGRQREVLELVFFHELTIEDAAEVMGVRLGTARTHYKRGKEAMREHLLDRGFQWNNATTSS